LVGWYSRREKKKEKGEDIGCHIAGERPRWTLQQPARRKKEDSYSIVL